MDRLVARRAPLLALLFPPPARSLIRRAGSLIQPPSRHVCRSLRRLAHIHAEGDSRTHQQPTQPFQLVFRQRVHRIDQHRHDPGRGVRIPQLQAAADNRVKKRLRLARPRPGRDQRRPSARNRANGRFLMPEHMRKRRDVFHLRMQHAFVAQIRHRRPLLEGPAQADVWPSHQWRLPSLRQVQQRPQLRVQPPIGERIRRELVAQEVPHHAFGKDDWVEHRVTWVEPFVDFARGRNPGAGRARSCPPSPGDYGSWSECCSEALGGVNADGSPLSPSAPTRQCFVLSDTLNLPILHWKP